MNSIIELSDGLLRDSLAIFLGWESAKRGARPAFASNEDQVSVLGPPRSGKSSAIFAPSVACHPGPVIVTSVRAAGLHPDLRDVTLRSRKALATKTGGFVGELVLDDAIEPKSRAVAWDITTGCSVWNVALERARSLAGAAIPLSQDNAGAWRNSVSSVLAPILHGCAMSGLDQHDMRNWLRYDDTEYSMRGMRDYLCGLYGDGHPSVRACDTSLAAGSEVQQNVLYVVNTDVLGVFSYENPWPSSPFDVDEFIRTWSTLYITIRPQRAEQARSLIAALVESVCSSWQASESSQGSGTLLLALDEVANVAPVATLPELVATGGGSGIQCLLGFQTSAQARRCWGDDGVDVVVKNPSHTVIFPGLSDRGFLDDLAALFGKETRYHDEINVAPNAPIRAGTADAAMLIEERGFLESSLAKGPPQARRREQIEREVGRVLARRRRTQRRRYMDLPEEDAGAAHAIIAELYALTTVVARPERRDVLEGADIYSGRSGSVFVRSAVPGTRRPRFGFHEVRGWWLDPVWSELL